VGRVGSPDHRPAHGTDSRGAIPKQTASSHDVSRPSITSDTTPGRHISTRCVIGPRRAPSSAAGPAPASGPGLGLYLVAVLTRQFGGDVRIEDNDPRGAGFVVELVQGDGGERGDPDERPVDAATDGADD